MHDHDSSLLKLQIRGTWMYRMTMVVLIFEIEPVPKIFESHHWIGGNTLLSRQVVYCCIEK